METPKIGKVMWCDLTVEDAETVSDFYSQVVGWEKSPVSMGDYNDYAMIVPDTQDGVSGVCHARGPNAYLPPQWLLYVMVTNLDESLEKCKSLGGKVIGEKRRMGEQGHYCLIQDPAGAYMMLCG
ncbi:MAG: VOC family protein [Saprospiraceae bacterium]